MRDLTQGSIPRQIIAMAVPIFAGMLLQTLYYIVDLYFVSRLGDAAIAGVSAAGNLTFVVFALTQMLGVGIVALISHSVGRKDAPHANLVFNQSLVLSLLCAVLTVFAVMPARVRTCVRSARMRRLRPLARPTFTGSCRVLPSSPWSPWVRRCAARHRHGATDDGGSGAYRYP
jgi:magnesium-transporting ATPase (P-type)